ncbi:hypothetical protein CWM47_04350 [Spirosoma pollinicola]|uniref:Uncharacterized protein n=1 Tax=Spirosoma pollinicola TaxID=2057025 RepID=A0A2K8YU56_9BACT|nr:hypothetical protein CWM47_04350 [Spirosoma pollinicola]
MTTNYLPAAIPLLGAVILISLSQLKAYYYSVVDRSRHRLPLLSFWNYFLARDSNRVIHSILFLKKQYSDCKEISQLTRKHNLLYSSLLIVYLLILVLRIIPFRGWVNIFTVDVAKVF